MDGMSPARHAAIRRGARRGLDRLTKTRLSRWPVLGQPPSLLWYLVAVTGADIALAGAGRAGVVPDRGWAYGRAGAARGPAGLAHLSRHGRGGGRLRGVLHDRERGACRGGREHRGTAGPGARVLVGQGESAARSRR